MHWQTIHTMSNQQRQTSTHTINIVCHIDSTIPFPLIILPSHTTHILQPTNTPIQPFHLHPNTTVHCRPTDLAYTNFKSWLGQTRRRRHWLVGVLGLNVVLITTFVGEIARRKINDAIIYLVFTETKQQQDPITGKLARGLLASNVEAYQVTNTWLTVPMIDGRRKRKKRKMKGIKRIKRDKSLLGNPSLQNHHYMTLVILTTKTNLIFLTSLLRIYKM